jgi:hypothetical protein
MKHLLTLLALLTILAAPAAAQTIKSLGFITTNGNIVANTGTNTLTFTNAIRVSSILLYQDGERTNSITYGADTLEFKQDGVTFFSLDYSSGGMVTFEKPISFVGTNTIMNAAKTQSTLFYTNAAPTNATNVSAWISVEVGTNSYRVPLYQ